MSWESDIQNPAEMNEETMLFVFEQCRERLKSVSESNDLLISRAYTLLGILITASTALLTVAFTIYKPEARQVDFAFIPFLIAALYCFIIALCLLHDIKPYTHAPCGNEPKNLLIEKVCKRRRNEVIKAEAENYQDRIDNNLERNNDLSRGLERSLRLCLWVPLILLLSLVMAFSLVPGG